MQIELREQDAASTRCSRDQGHHRGLGFSRPERLPRAVHNRALQSSGCHRPGKSVPPDQPLWVQTREQGTRGLAVGKHAREPRFVAHFHLAQLRPVPNWSGQDDHRSAAVGEITDISQTVRREGLSTRPATDRAADLAWIFHKARAERDPGWSGPTSRSELLQTIPGARTNLMNSTGVNMVTPKGLPRSSRSRSLVTTHGAPAPNAAPR